MTVAKLGELHREVRRGGSAERAAGALAYFKTGPGEYGEGDTFAGLTVPQSRRIARRFNTLPLESVKLLLRSPVHEERFIALLLLIQAFRAGGDSTRADIYEYYLQNTDHVNNWDLVDTSAPPIVGEYVKNKDRVILKELATSAGLWNRRISVIATYQLIKDLGQYKDTFTVADMLLRDEHDLIQKAVGWMLREVGKLISQDVEEAFLRPRYSVMPRTALRYAIERFPEDRRQAYLKGQI